MVAISVLVKLLAINSKLYFSTDFEVHRNWLAITQSVPYSQWYVESRNQWTLDYPPFFAYFEYLLGLFARLVDPKIVDVNAFDYSAWTLIAFQRLSVIIISDLVLGIGVWLILPAKHRIFGLILTLFSSSIFIVDHIHFQYNGMLIGLLLISKAFAQKNRWYWSALAFSVLICFKHLYIAAAPVYLVYFLRHFVLERSPFNRLFRLCCIILGVSGIALIPIVMTGQVQAMLQRLFPFERGLVHAYWAPNFWALYLASDRVLDKFFIKNLSSVGSPTAGIVGDITLSVLPNVSPSMCAIVSLISYLPLLYCIWQDKTRKTPFSTYVGLGNAVVFLFGWHVHEKALMLVLIPLVMSALSDRKLAIHVWRLSQVSCACLLPLLPRGQETVLKWMIALTGSVLDSHFLGMDSWDYRWMSMVYGSEVYRVFFHELIFGKDRMQFLPLLLTSVSTAVSLLLVLKDVFKSVWPQHVNKKGF